MTADDIKLRPFGTADYEMVGSWMDTVACQFLEVGWPSLGSPTDHPFTHALVGVQGAESVGAVLLDFYDDDEAIVSVLVAPHARGRGVARTLLRAAVAASGASVVKADVLIHNESSAKALLGAGFVEMHPPADQVPAGRFFVWTRTGEPYLPSWG